VDIDLGTVMGELHRHFRPEFLNRVDDVLLFKPGAGRRRGRRAGGPLREPSGDP
jgi:hypothetical protein